MTDPVDSSATDQPTKGAGNTAGDLAQRMVMDANCDGNYQGPLIALVDFVLVKAIAKADDVSGQRIFNLDAGELLAGFEKENALPFDATFWQQESLKWAEMHGKAIDALMDAIPKLCKWCAEGHPINDDKDGVNRDGRYHHVHKWGIGLRECAAVKQRKLIESLSRATEQNQ